MWLASWDEGYGCNWNLVLQMVPKAFYWFWRNFYALHGIKVKVILSSLDFSTISDYVYMALNWPAESDSDGGNNTKIF